MKKKVLIITYYWPPAGGPGVQRWLKLSNYLLENNIKPVIYTPSNPKYPTIDNSLLEDVNPEIEVIKQPIFEPFGSWFSRIRKKGIPKKKNQSIFERLSIYLRGNFFIPDSRIFWISPSVNFLSKYILKHNVETIITTGPPHSLHLIGLKLKRMLNITWHADFRDPWTKINYHEKLKLSLRSRKKHLELENKVLNSCDKIIVTSNKLLKEYIGITKTPILLITNGYDYKKQKLELDEKFSITHIGRLLPGRNPKILWKALKELSMTNENFRNNLKINFIGNVGDNIRSEIKSNNLEDSAVYHDYIEYNHTIPYLIKSQILLLVESDDKESSYAIPAKIFEYINSGRPIIAIGPKDSEVKDIINDTESGKYFLYNQYDDLLSYLLNSYHLYESKQLYSSSINIDKYHRKNLAKKLSDIILDK